MHPVGSGERISVAVRVVAGGLRRFGRAHRGQAQDGAPPFRAGRGAAGCALAGALLAQVLSGCGGVDLRADIRRAEDDVALRRIAARRRPRATLTLEEIGMVYPEEAWTLMKRPFPRVYHQISELDVFDWAYLHEVARDRRKLRLKARQDREELARRARAELARQKKERAKAKAEARARSKRKAVLEAAERTSQGLTP